MEGLTDIYGFVLKYYRNKVKRISEANVIFCYRYYGIALYEVHYSILPTFLCV